MRIYHIYFLVIFIMINQNITAQEYTAPFDFKMLLSGTFGELRSNHFHAGIDIKTQGVEGQKVRAISDGYVSRIKVSTWGYGKAIYITHPQTGHTSVYAHLQKFSEKIDHFAKKEHYKKQSFEINFFPIRDEIKIKKGEIIGLSGNSGSSNGAHLHLEIRDTKTQRPINPLKFGFKIKDNIPPLLKKLKIYAFDTTLINGYNQSKIYSINKQENIHTINDTVKINGSFGLGIFAYDKSNNAYNKNGIYSIKLLVDGDIHYEFKADELNFNTTRYINAHIDYYEKKKNKIKYHRCYKLPNNRLENYSKIIDNGIINFNDTLTHKINIEVSDIYNNMSILSFNIKATKQPFLMKCGLPQDTINEKFRFDTENSYRNDNINLHMKAFSLYEPINFHYSNTDSISGVFGEVHHIHNHNTPVHKKYTLALKADIVDSLKEKMYVATTDMQGNFWYIGGEWVNGFLKIRTREFGNFCIIADTIKPKIRGLNIYPEKILNNQNSIKLTIEDKESGIESYRGEIDGKWVLMDYDHKKNILRLDIDKNIKKGEHKFILKVVDKVGNTSIYEAKFTYLSR